MDKRKIISLSEYREKKEKTKTNDNCFCKMRDNFAEDEERLKTLNLFMKVLATMKKESY